MKRERDKHRTAEPDGHLVHVTTFASGGNLREFAGEGGLARFAADIAELYPWDEPTIAAAYLLGDTDERGRSVGPGLISIVSIVTKVSADAVASVVDSSDAPSVWAATSTHRVIAEAARNVVRVGSRLAAAMIGPWPIGGGKAEVLMTAEHRDLGPIVRMWAAPPGARRPEFRCDLHGPEVPECLRVLFPEATVN